MSRLDCESCDIFYFVRNDRNFNTRSNEYKGDFLKEKWESNYYKHLIEESYEFNRNSKILHNGTKGLKLNFLDAS